MQVKAGRVVYIDYHDQDDKSCEVKEQCFVLYPKLDRPIRNGKVIPLMVYS